MDGTQGHLDGNCVRAGGFFLESGCDLDVVTDVSHLVNARSVTNTVHMDIAGGQAEAVRQAISAELRGQRARADISMEVLAKRSGLSESSILRFERGIRSPNVEQLAQLCDAFRIRLADFMASALVGLGK